MSVNGRKMNSVGSDSDISCDGQFRPPPSDGTDSASSSEAFRFENKCSLANDLSFLAMMPEYCDVTFLVGENQQPMCGVKAILASRSRTFKNMFYGDSKDPKKPVKKGSKKGKSPKSDSKESTYLVPEFEPTVFKELLQYAHCGSVVLEARTLLGLTNAADHYGLDELKVACRGFLDKCLSNDTVVSLLSSAEKYIQYKATRILVQKIFEFIDQNAEEILGQKSFLVLPQHIVRLVLARDELKASETTKFVAAYQWVVRHCQEDSQVTYQEAFEPFAEVIEFHHIPVAELMRLVKPSKCVSDTVVLNALAYQADPNAVDASKYRIKQRSGGSKQRSSTFSSPRLRSVSSAGNPYRCDSAGSYLSHQKMSSSTIRSHETVSDTDGTPERDVFGYANGNDDSKDDGSNTSDERCLTSPSDASSIRSGSSESLGTFSRQKLTNQSNISIKSAPHLAAPNAILSTEL